MPSTPEVTHDVARSRFVIESETGPALLDYVLKGNTADLVHTAVPEALEGSGYGTALMDAAVAWARAEQKTIIPSCAFARHYVETHPGIAALLAKSS